MAVKVSGTTVIDSSRNLTNIAGANLDGLTVDTNTLHVDAANNRVGVGTTTPSQKLDVAGNGQFTQSTYGFVGVTSDTVQGQLAANGSTGVELRAVSNHPLGLFTNNTERARLTASGNLGIGTTTPTQKLDVNGAITVSSGLLFGIGQSYLYSSTALQAALRIGDDGPFLVFDDVGSGGAKFANASGYLAFGTSTNEDMRITTSGRVLIDRTVDTLGGGAGVNLQVGSGAGSSGMTFHAATTSLSDIQFADGITGNESYRGMIRYDHNGDYMGFWTAAAERVRIDDSGNLKFNSGFGSVGTAYAARAWVNFNGTGTVAIRASGNVTSITDNGTGLYTVNFTTAMPDANYAVSVTSGDNNKAAGGYSSVTAPTTTAVAVKSFNDTFSASDSAWMSVVITR